MEGLGVPEFGHPGIRLEKAAPRGVVEPGVVVLQPQAGLPPLAGVEAVSGWGADSSARLPVGAVPAAGHHSAVPAHSP